MTASVRVMRSSNHEADPSTHTASRPVATRPELANYGGGPPTEADPYTGCNRPPGDHHAVATDPSIPIDVARSPCIVMVMEITDTPPAAADRQQAALESEMAEILGDYHRHQGEAAALLNAAEIQPGNLDEDGEPYEADPISPAEYRAAAAVHAQLALAAATALGALATLRASQAGGAG